MNSRGSLLLTSLLCILCLGLVLGCSKATPVAPSGTTLALSANPGRIASATGTSTLTAILVKGNGQPVNRGTQVRFDTNLGTVDSLVETDDSGVARATLRGDGRVGMATVHASTGALTPVALMVQIGTAAGSITVQANPSVIDSSGGTVTLLALVRDDSGQPLAGVQVNFGADVGTLASGGGPITTDANGQATDHLTVRSTDLPGSLSSFMVKASVAAGSATLSSGTFTIQVRRSGAASISLQATPPSIDATGGTISLLALVRDETGRPLSGAQVNFGTDIGTLRSRGGIVTADANGQATDKLDVASSDLTNNISSFTVRATVAGPTGTLSTGTFTVQVRTAKPVADFTFQNLGSFKVQFMNQSTGQNLTYQWNFGDNTFSAETNPLHQFSGAGPFQVQLTATNAATGEASVKVKTVTPN